MWIKLMKDFIKADICCLRAIALLLGTLLISCGKVLVFCAHFWEQKKVMDV